MTSSTSETHSSAQNSDQRHIDKQTAGVIEAIMIHSFSLANKGLIPSEQQLTAYIDSLDEAVLLQRIRNHPSSAASRASTADDAELLRWARLVGRPVAN